MVLLAMANTASQLSLAVLSLPRDRSGAPCDATAPCAEISVVDSCGAPVVEVEQSTEPFAAIDSARCSLQVVARSPSRSSVGSLAPAANPARL
jgi:hypothetical protein